MRRTPAIALAAVSAIALPGCVTISRPGEGYTVPSPVRVRAIASAPTANAGDRQVRADARIDGVLRQTFTAPAGGADAIDIDGSYGAFDGAHTLTVTASTRTAARRRRRATSPSELRR